MWSRFASVVWLAACTGAEPEVVPFDPGTRPTEPTTPAPEACAVPVSVAPDDAGVPPLGGTRFRAMGGSGQFTFRLVDDQSGAILNELTGEYVAGAAPGVIDTVAADDPICGGSAFAAVDVFGPMELRPVTAVVPPGTTFTIESRGGSGQLDCALARNETGGSLAGCTWTAGPTIGTDEIDVVDRITGEEATGAYSVDPDVELHLWGRKLYLPAGHPFAPTWVGGTQIVDLSPSGAGLQVTSDGELLGVDEGAYTVGATDHYASALTTSFEVEVVAARVAGLDRDGERAYWGDVLGAQLDGDDLEDAIVATVDPSVGAHYSGAVYVYAGTAGGLDPVPVQVFSVDQEYAYAGRGVAVGDVDGDGLLDLAVGADGWDEGASADRGRIDVYRGAATGFFEPEPSWTLIGQYGGDHLGHAVAICDVDGDGIDDLASAAYGLEDRDVDPQRSTEGGLHVWRGTPQGLAPDPTWRAYSGVADLQMGRRLVAGDADGDGRCDLAASSHTRSLDFVGQDGIVWLFRGSSLTGPVPVSPDRVYTSDDADDNIQLGRALAMGDVDGDGLDDLVAGGWYADGDGSSLGAVWVFSAADHLGQSLVSSSEARATVRGTDNSDYLGIGVAVGLDGALWVGASSDEVPKGASNTGAVWRFDPSVLVGAVETSQADASWAGAVGGDWFGTAIGVVGDGAVTLASLDDTFGVEAGAPWWLDPAGGATQLELPGEASGGKLGQRSSFGFRDGELVGGAWGVPSLSGYDAGAAFRFDAAGAVDREWRDLPEQGAADRLGYAVDGAGDFDGDGVEDLVVVANNDARPSSFDAGVYANPLDCPGSISGSGSAWVFRGDASAPSFVVHGYGSSDRLEVVAGGFDHDGDGFDDLVLGSTGYGAEGGFSIVHGRLRDPGGVLVICDAAHWLGVSSGSRLGSAVDGAGDIDGDGCDEVIVGADSDDLGQSNQGSARILWGYGSSCGSTVPEVTTLVSGVANDRVGSAVAGGDDVDGDGIPDVVVGAFDAEVVAGQDVGAVWLVRGSLLRTAPRQVASTLPSDAGTTVTVLAATARFAGDVVDGELGSDVALVGGLVAAGQRFGQSGAGAVVLLRFAGGAFDPEPVGLIGGEAAAPGGQLGAALRADRGGSVLGVGAPLSDAGALDAGAIYPFPID